MAGTSGNIKFVTENDDLVRRNEILKSQVALENKARRQWFTKWGCLLDFDKVLVEVATKRGISAEELQEILAVGKKKFILKSTAYETKTAEPVPITSSGVVGWRSSPECSLEKMDPLYVSPKSTLPKSLPQSKIALG